MDTKRNGVRAALLAACIAGVVLVVVGLRAHAQPAQPNLIVRDANGVQQANCAFVVSGVLYPCHVEVTFDANGVPHLKTATPAALTSTGFVQVSGFSTATAFTPPAGSTLCIVQAEGASVRFRTDGTNPTASVGQLMQIGQPLSLSANLAGTRFVPTAGTATLDADCYK